MRPFRLDDEFQGNSSGLKATVISLIPHNHFGAVVRITQGSTVYYEGETVFAAEFLNGWSLIKEGPLVVD